VSTAAIETRVGGRPRREDWAVGRAVRERMLRLQISLAPLARETGLAETTIRYIDKPALHAEVGPVKAEIATLEHAVRAMEANIDAINQSECSKSCCQLADR
jgi:hypothetical protein